MACRRWLLPVLCGSKNVLSDVLRMWKSEEPISFYWVTYLGVLVVSLKVGELQAAWLVNGYPLAKKDPK